jgi:hypothetical protein
MPSKTPGLVARPGVLCAGYDVATPQHHQRFRIYWERFEHFTLYIINKQMRWETHWRFFSHSSPASGCRPASLKERFFTRRLVQNDKHSGPYESCRWPQTSDLPWSRAWRGKALFWSPDLSWESGVRWAKSLGLGENTEPVRKSQCFSRTSFLSVLGQEDISALPLAKLNRVQALLQLAHMNVSECILCKLWKMDRGQAHNFSSFPALPGHFSAVNWC